LIRFGPSLLPHDDELLSEVYAFTGYHIGATGAAAVRYGSLRMRSLGKAGFLSTTTFEKESSLFRERCKPSFQRNRFEGDRQREAYSGRRLIDGQFGRAQVEWMSGVARLLAATHSHGD
jgi:hypothetical protein